MPLHGELVCVAELSASIRAEMLALMQAHYQGVEPHTFARDLARKDWVVLLREPAAGASGESPAGALRGFSTQRLIRQETDSGVINVLFSGDTIIDRDHWGSLALPTLVGSLLSTLLARDPAVPLYWLLISKGFRTYRFLPVFFQTFFPAVTAATPPALDRLMQTLGRSQFGAAYDPTAGVLRAAGNAQRLREDLGEPPAGRKPDPHIEYFFRRNPGWRTGDELLCLARFEPANLKPFIRRTFRDNLPLTSAAVPAPEVPA